MTFLNSIALWGLLLVTIPVLIHLFSFRRVKKLYFSNVNFLAYVKSKSNTRNSIRKWLVLALRALAIVFLIFAFAQPLFESNVNEINPKSSSVFYLDNSLSMGRTSEHGNDLLTDGLKALAVLAEGYSEGTRVPILTNTSMALNRPVLKSELENKLAEIDLSNRSQTVSQIIARSERMDSRFRDVYLISDLQKTSFSDIENSLEDTARVFHLIKMNARSDENLYIDSVVLDNPIGFPTENRFRILVRNVGNQIRKEVLVKVFKDQVQISSFTENFDPNSNKWIAVDLTQSDELSGSYTVEVNDSEFTYDNKHFFVVGQFVKPTVYQVYQKFPNQYVKSVYSNDNFFNLKVSSIGNIDQEVLLSSDLIVLDGLDVIPDWLTSVLQGFTNSIVLLPSRNSVKDSFASYLGQVIEDKEDTSNQVVSTKSLEHPFFNSVFNQRDNQSNMPWVESIYDLGDGTDVILKSVLGESLLVEFGQNKFVFSFPIKDAYTNLHKHGLFLPLMYKVSIAHKTNTIYSYQIDDELLSIETDSLLFSGNLELRNGDEVIVPVLRNIEDRIYLEMPEITTQPGFYDLFANEIKIRTLAFNLPKEESEIGTFTDDELAQLISGRNNVTYENIDNVLEMSKKYATADGRLPLWKYALLLALLFLIVELTLLRTFR